MRKPATDKEWINFGKKIYDIAIKHFIDKPCEKVEIPLQGLDGTLVTIMAGRPMSYVEQDREGNVHMYYLLSDGKLKKRD